MHLIRFRPRANTIRLPDGRLVKVTVDESHSIQHVEDGDRLHATVVPIPVRVLLRRFGEPRLQEQYELREDVGLWAPVPPKEK